MLSRGILTFWKQTLADNDLEDKPYCQVFNMDETGMPLDPKSVRAIFAKGEKNPVAFSSGNKSQITVVLLSWQRRETVPARLPGCLRDRGSQMKDDSSIVVELYASLS